MPEAKANKAVAKKGEGSSEPVAWENPLIPNKKLRALYVAMVELRLFDEHIAARPVRASSRSTKVRGEEGCRVCTTIDLKPGDLTSEGTAGLAAGLLRGAKLPEVMHRTLTPGVLTNEDAAPVQLPVVARMVDRLHLAMGAALALKATRKGALLIVYTHSSEATLAEWKPMLRFAAQQVLPVIFAVLPAAAGTRAMTRPGQLSLASSKCGVPGISVDAADPVALYRVAQESMLRARARGGPVLMECITFQPAGKKVPQGDPIATMQEFLLHRRIVDQAWLNGVERRFTAQLEAAVLQENRLRR